MYEVINAVNTKGNPMTKNRLLCERILLHFIKYEKRLEQKKNLTPAEKRHMLRLKTIKSILSK